MSSFNFMLNSAGPGRVVFAQAGGHPTNPEKITNMMCEKMFLKPHQLRQHQRIHDGTNQSQCGVYGQKFVSEATLRNLIHTDSKPHQFQMCGMQFRHMLIHNGAKPRRCKICDMKFRHRSTLSCHMRKHERPQ